MHVESGILSLHTQQVQYSPSIQHSQSPITLEVLLGKDQVELGQNVKKSFTQSFLLLHNSFSNSIS